MQLRRLLVLPCVLFLLLCVPGVATVGHGEDMLLYLPAIIASSQDQDGDGLPDSWERQGYWDGGVHVDLPALGADPRHKDLFVWMDYMVRPGGVSLAPSQTVINNIIAVFNNAPVSNPDGTTGIRIHPILKNQVTYKQTLGVSTDYVQVWTDVDVLKNASFTPAFRKAFRYMIWANSYNEDTSSGLARDIPAKDFLVTLGEWPTAGGSDWEKLGTFIHELGHCLGLTHGGTDHQNYKPNYLSVMNYTFQVFGLYKNGTWGDQGQPLHFDYQRMDTPALDKSHLNEPKGMTGADDLSAYGTVYLRQYSTIYVQNVTQPIDWNGNGVMEADIAEDINAGEDLGLLTCQNNWEHINFSANGQIGPDAAAQEAKADLQPMPLELQHELNLETVLRLREHRQF